MQAKTPKSMANQIWHRVITKTDRGHWSYRKHEPNKVVKITLAGDGFKGTHVK